MSETIKAFFFFGVFVTILWPLEAGFAQFVSQAQDKQKVIFARQTLFTVPFEISGPQNSDVKEVELIYSMDQGKNWFSYQKSSPDMKSFQFQALQNAEYWLAFRLIDHQGGAKLAQADVPSLRVLVDTISPKLSLNMQRGKSGEILVDWKVDDVALTPGPPEIYLGYDQNTTWVRLAVDQAKIKQIDTERSGQTLFFPPKGTQIVNIRLEMSDTAGNREIKTTKIDLSKDDWNLVTSQDGNKTDSVTVIPPRPLTKKEALPVLNPPSEMEKISNLNFKAEIAPPVNAEALPHYASNAVGAETEKTASFFLPTLDILLNSPQNVPENKNVENSAFEQLSTSASAPVSSLPPVEEVKVTPETAPDAIKNEKSEVPPPEPVFPGKITLVSLKESLKPQMVIRWHVGDAALSDSKIDVYRSSEKFGPWKPVVFDLNNTGEHLWDVSEEEFTPFYLRIDLRSTNGLYTDFTNREINIMNHVRPK